jgi:DNA-binding GntR family transcriptional regulator
LRMQISDDIVRGMLAPGATLDETELARRFNVSRTPVREAIRLLASSGLVEARPHRSAVVARPGKPQLTEMFEALRELEALCAGLAAARRTSQEHDELRRINETLVSAVREGDPQRYHEVNEAFHGAIYAGSHNAYLARLATETRARVAPFSRAQFRTAGRLARSQAEHEAVLAAIGKSDAKAATAAMRRHIESVHEAYGDYLVGA